MKKLWLTYAWEDNKDEHVDFRIRQLLDAGIDVQFDRRILIPGQRLWSQIASAITDPARCDAWAILLTRSSASSEPCVEELAFAINRALDKNGNGFPVFALLHNVSPSELPPSLKVRLCIPLDSPNWIELVFAAVEKRSPEFLPRENIPNYNIRIHGVHENGRYLIEVNPRFDRISPFCVAVDAAEKHSGNVKCVMTGPSGSPPNGSFMRANNEGFGTLSDGTEVWFLEGMNEASPRQSYFVRVDRLPSRMWVGPAGHLPDPIDMKKEFGQLGQIEN